MKNRAHIVLALSLIAHSAYGAVVIKGNDTTCAPYAFKTKVNVRALDPSSGIFFVGLQDGSDAYTLSKICRYTGKSVARFTGIAPDELQDTTIEFLTLSCADNAAARLVGVRAEDILSFLSRKQVFILKNDGTRFSESVVLHDANDDNTAGVVGVAASSTHIVAPVRANSGNYGDEKSGLALIAINCDLSLTTKDATTGLDGNLAQELDMNSDEYTGDTNSVTIIDAAPQILYDKLLDRFYTGISMNTGTSSGDIAKSVVIARINPSVNNNLTLEPIAPNGVTSAGADNQIIVAEVDATELSLTVKKLGIVHASTGPSYLIVAGGSTSDGSNPGNTVYALPLVNDPTSPSTHGTLANKNAALVNGVFTTAATAAAEIPTSAEAAAFIGASSLPIDATHSISDMVVLGDTVYVSTNTDPDTTNEPGIFYSQALFDEEGKVIAWTPWTKKALPFNAFPGRKLPGDATHNGKVKFFQVDLVNGKIWFVEGTTEKVVGSTSWETPRTASTDTPLVNQLNSALLCSGSYSVLDLDQSTRGICEETTARYALFGSARSVVFVRTSQAQTAAINAPQSVPTDFSNPENFKISQLDIDAGCVQALEYARQLNSDGNQNYFFAGTPNGLYVFADANKNGFTITNSVNALNSAPFTTGQWHKVTTIPGSVVALRTTGNTLYILTQEVGSSLKSTLYRIDFDTDVDTMFANPIVIAQTNSSPLANIELFYDIGIISVDASDGSQEQVVLATNNGLYQSTRAGGVQAATDATDAAWTLIDSQKTTINLGVAYIDNTPIASNCPTILPTTLWPFSQTDPSSKGIYNASKLHQVSGTTSGNLVFKPDPFNSKENSALFTNLEPITYFFSDGARRFFIINRQADPLKVNNLMVLPYTTKSWNIHNQIQAIVADPQLKRVSAIFWIRQIGATGSILMGTNAGIFSLD